MLTLLLFFNCNLQPTLFETAVHGPDVHGEFLFLRACGSLINPQTARDELFAYDACSSVATRRCFTWTGWVEDCHRGKSTAQATTVSVESR